MIFISKDSVRPHERVSLVDLELGSKVWDR